MIFKLLDHIVELRLEREELKRTYDKAVERRDREIAELRDWRANVTVALQNPGGAFFEDLPKHIKSLVKERDELRAELLQLKAKLERARLHLTTVNVCTKEAALHRSVDNALAAIEN